MCIGNCSLSKLCFHLGLWKYWKVLERTPICFSNFLSDLKHKNGASTRLKTSDITLFPGKRHLIYRKKNKVVLTSPREVINLCDKNGAYVGKLVAPVTPAVMSLKKLNCYDILDKNILYTMRGDLLNNVLHL